MKHLKTLTLSALLSFPLLVSTAGAQPREGMLDFKVARMQEQLKLSDEQANKVYDIFSQLQEQGSCREMKTFTARRDCMKDHKGKIDEKLATVLNKEQQEQFAEFRKDRANRMGKRGGGMRGDCPLQAQE